MVQNQLRSHLDHVGRRLRVVRLWWALAFSGLILASMSLLTRFSDVSDEGRSSTLIAFGVLAAVACAISFGTQWFATPNYRRLAARVERKFPELDSRLMASVQIDVGQDGPSLGFLEQSVIHQTLVHATRHHWTQIVSPYSVWGSRIATALTWGCFGLFLFLLWNNEELRDSVLGGNQDKQIVTYSETKLVSVDPGDTEIERGTALIVFARYSGSLPREATLIVTDAKNEERRITMSNSFADPVFAARVSSVTEELVYRVELDDIVSESYQVKVFEYPRLERSDISLSFPSYSGRAEKRVEDARRVSALEGTDVRVEFYLNKLVEEVRFVDESGGGESVEVTLENESAMRYVANFTLDQTRRFRLYLFDEDGRENRDPPELVFNAIPNQPPQIKVLKPSRDVRVSPLEELDLRAEMSDDFGVAAYGLTYNFHGETKDLEIGRWDPPSGEPGDEITVVPTKAVADHLLYFELLEAEPNEMLTYYFWAEDFDGAGERRRVFSDMFIADVRPFEEIFREGEQPPGGGEQGQQGQQGQQGGGEAAQLFELQLQIMNGTWSVIRRETKSELTSTFTEDVDVLRTSQESAFEQAKEMSQEVSDPELTPVIESTLLSMQRAQVALGRALLDKSRVPLQEAMDAERAALEGLMKLRANEFEVTQQQQNQQQQQSSSQSSRQGMQQQLDQLELSNDENRYQEQSEASETEEDQAAREDRQMLNRLRELARRQEDLNKQLQELQTALEAAQTEEEREAIERQLKRLREEQEEILRETDELAERADQSENREEMTESREQIEEARENVRRANEALKENEISEAAAAGARAESQFEDLRDEFQRKTSGAFQQRMEEMRDQAETIRERERELSEALDDLDNPENRSLRDDSKEQILNELTNQRDEVRNLMENMKDTVKEAEGAEPLLASNLYDAYRNAEQDQLDQALQQTQQMLDQGFLEDAGELEDIASESIEELADSVNEAANSLLGDQTEALRRAERTLDDLAQALDAERGELDPNQEATQNGGQGQPNEQSADDPNSEQQSDSQSNSGESQDGQPGDQQGDPQNQDAQSADEQRGENNPQDGQPQQGQSQQGQSQQGQGQQGQDQENQDQENQDQQSQGQGQQGQQQQDQQQQGQQGQTQDGQPQDGQPQDGQPQQGQQGQQGQQPGEQQGGQQPGQSQQGGENRQPGQQGGRTQDANDGNPAGLDRLLDFDGGGNPRPLTGDDYREWSDALRDVEEMIGDPELRDEAARIRERVRDIRSDYRRNSKDPDWEVVNDMVIVPLYQLRNRVSEELMRRASKEALVPIDRDPIPEDFIQDVGEYYERIGSGR